MGEAEDIPPVGTAEPGAWPGGVAAWRARLTGPTARKGALAIGAQGVASVVNFGVGIALARFASQEEFGAYVLIFAILLFAGGVQAALLTGPMAVLGAAREEDDFRRYVTSLGLVQVGASVGLALLAFGGAGVLGVLSGRGGLLGAFWGMAAAVAFVQGMEFFRRVMFARLEAGKVLLNELAYAALMAGGMILLLWHERAGGGEWLTARNVFVVMAVSAAAAGALGLWQTRRRFTRGPLGMRGHLVENWRFGRWALGGSLLNFASSRAYHFLLAALWSTGAVAAFSAPRLIVAPVQVVLIGVGGMLSPLMSKRACEGETKTSLARYALFALPVLLWCLLVAVWPRPIVAVVIGPKYLSAEGVLIARLFALNYALFSLSWFAGLMLQAFRRPEAGFYANLVSACATVIVGPVLVYLGGPTGATTGAVLTVLCWVTVNLLFLMRTRSIASAEAEAC